VPASPDKFDGLGPAIVLLPSAGMPTNATCGLTFADDVVDKSGIQVCAPPGGAPADGSTAPDCTPGDVSAFSFKTEPLRFSTTTNVDPAVDFVIKPVAPIDPASLPGSITVFQGATPVTAFTSSVDATTHDIRITWTTPLTSATEYTVTISTAIKDTFGKPLPAPVTFTFTTM